MKTAQLPDGRIVEAGEQVPQQGTCPYCGGVVTLRRRLMNRVDVGYFCRHHDNQSQDCPARRGPAPY